MFGIEDDAKITATRFEISIDDVQFRLPQFGTPRGFWRSMSESSVEYMDIRKRVEVDLNFVALDLAPLYYTRRMFRRMDRRQKREFQYILTGGHHEL